MKLAITTWNNRVAPVFDVAGTAIVVELRGGELLDRREVILNRDDPAAKVRLLREEGVGELVCGAISRDVEQLVLENGIRLFPFIAGDADSVIQAWMGRRLESGAFWMPGCGCGGRGHGRGRRRGRAFGAEGAYHAKRR